MWVAGCRCLARFEFDYSAGAVVLLISRLVLGSADWCWDGAGIAMPVSTQATAVTDWLVSSKCDGGPVTTHLLAIEHGDVLLAQLVDPLLSLRPVAVMAVCVAHLAPVRLKGHLLPAEQFKQHIQQHQQNDAQLKRETLCG